MNVSLGRSLEEFLVAILRGAATVVGCDSTNLILINERTQEISIRLGLGSGNQANLGDIEKLLGASFQAITIPVAQAHASLIYRCFRDREVHQSSSIAEMVGPTFPAAVVEQLDRLAGEHAFISVPAQGPRRVYGVLVFQKQGHEPFTRRQSEVLLRYARRIGEILENSGTGQGQSLVSSRHPGASGPLSLEEQLLQVTLGEAAPVLTVDAALTITSCNDATAGLLGYTPGELLGRPLSELLPDPPTFVDILSGQLLEAAAPSSVEPAFVRRKDGTALPVRIESLLLADDRGAVGGFLLLLQTDRADADQEGLLWRQDRLSTMGEMAAQLAHEIRNPLLAVGATLESLRLDPACPAEHREIMESLGREIVRLDMTLRDYLAARREMSFAPVDLLTVVQDARTLLENAYRLSGKTVTTDIAPDLAVRADREALRHVFFNLLHNALEASPADGEVVCRATAGRDVVSVTIDDRGPGLAAAPGECFQPFVTTKMNGAGLGLSVCHRIIRAHGGFVDLRNRAEGGCRAVVVLPVRQETGL
ncbi:MAG: GAF domain-containing protein [Deltaproteobacteria bacterium]|nr:GAF domain-containing protein [Deltaproteobacteria bacterium]